MARPRSRLYEKDDLLGCWRWCGATTDRGYPIIWRDGKTQLARRLFYEDKKGPIPDGCRVVTTCGNRDCVWSAHLEAVPH